MIKSQEITIGTEKFLINTYEWGDPIGPFFSSLVTPAVQYTELTLGGWMDGEMFNVFEGITFRGAAFDFPTEYNNKNGETFYYVVNQIKQKFVNLGLSHLVPDYAAKLGRITLESVLVEMGGNVIDPFVSSMLQSIENAVREELEKKARKNES